jgi:hypothetical protein
MTSRAAAAAAAEAKAKAKAKAKARRQSTDETRKKDLNFHRTRTSWEKNIEYVEVLMSTKSL